MSLRFIIGRAGAGKTVYCLEQIRQELLARPQGPGIILLVPEQGSFQMEAALAGLPGLGGAIRAQVLSFRRLAWKVFQEVGGAARPHLREIGKRMILRSLLEQNQDRLKVFYRAARQPNFSDRLARALAEMKRYCLTPEHLATMAASLKNSPNKLLRDKLEDLSLLYAEMEGFLGGRFTDPDDYLSLLAERLPGSFSLSQGEIWIDGFSGFTPQEYKVIQSLLIICDRVNVALCLDSEVIQLPVDEQELFFRTHTTYLDLLGLAQEAGIEIEEPYVLEEHLTEKNTGHRFAGSPWLRHLERNFFSWPRCPYSEEIDGFKLVAGHNRQAEVEGVAREIRTLSREQGYQWKQVSVLVRDLAPYEELVERVFADYEIPVFIDHKRSIRHHPLIELMRSALETVFFGWTYAPVFRYLKTDLVSVSRDEVDQLENYVLAHGIKGKRWIDGKPWDYQRVYAIGEKNQELSQVQRSELAYINKIKELAIRDLADFYMTVEQNSTIRGISAGLYTLINNLGIKDRLEDWATEARENKQLDRAREHAQIYNQVLLLLDEIVEALGDQESSAESYLKVLEAGLENLRLGLIPPGLDQVFIGSLDRSRNPEVRANFLIGINDGILPARPSAEGILTNQERELLLARGLNLAPDAKRCLFDEQYLVYLGLTRASEYLWISYALADQEGRALNPSVIIQDLQEVFPGIRVQDCPLEPAGVDCQEDLDFISAPRRSLTYLTVKLREANSGLDISSVWRDVYNALIMNNRYRVARSTAGLFYQNRERCLQPETVKRLYGSSLRAGITQIEQFNACPFAHFLKYGLRLKERETWKLRPMDLGQFFHAALKNFGERLNQDVPNWITITVEMCNQLVDEIILQLLPQLQNEIMISSVRQQYLGQKLLRIVRSSAWALVEQMRCGSFRPLAMEMGFGYPGELPALRIALENAIENSSVNSLENKISEQLVDALDTFKPIYTIAEDKAEGNCLELVGRIDRVDWAKSPAGSYLRVVDYKSGSAGINLNDIHHGLGLQLLTYLEVALNNAQQMAGEEAIPGGMLYFRIRKPMLAVKGQVAPEKIAQELRKVYKLKGLVLEDRDLIELMEKGLIGDSSIIPVGFKVNGEFKSRSAVLSRNQFAGLRRYLRQILKDTGRGILAGEADIQPYQRKKKKACGYCHLKSVCQFDTTVGNQYRVLQDLEDRLIWHLIGDGGEGS